MRATLHCGARASHCSGFAYYGAQALGTEAAVVAARGLRSCGSRALEHGLRSPGAQTWLLCGMVNLPGPGLEPVFPALAGGFLSTIPPGKSYTFLFIFPSIMVTQRLKGLPAMWEAQVRSLCWEDPLEKEMTTHSSILAWRIPWTVEPGGLLFRALQSLTQLNSNSVVKTIGFRIQYVGHGS